MTHLQGDRRPTPPVTVDDVVHQTGNPHLSARATETSSSTITVEYTSGELSGEEFTFGIGEFGEVFEV